MLILKWGPGGGGGGGGGIAIWEESPHHTHKVMMQMGYKLTNQIF